MQAKSFLQQVKKLDCMIENKLEEREQWMLMATNITAPAAPETGVRVQSSGSKKTMENAIVQSIDIGTQIEETICMLYEARAQIIAVIEQLSCTEYDLLYRLYVGKIVVDRATGRRSVVRQTLQEAASESGKSYSYMTTMHGVALRNVQRIIDVEHIVPLEEQLRQGHGKKKQ